MPGIDFKIFFLDYRWDKLPLNGKEKLEGFAQLLSALEFRKSEEGIYSKKYLSVVLGQNEDAKEDVVILGEADSQDELVVVEIDI